MNAKYYKPSGKFSPIGLVKAAAIGILGILLASWVYGYLMAWIPLVYLLIIGVFCFGLAAGGLTSLGITVGKIRNSGVALLLGLVVTLVGMYSSWVAWIFAETSQQVFVWAPQELWATIRLLSLTGVWSMRDFTPTGWVLGGFWIAEALIVMGTALYMVRETASNSTFCEDCENWMEDPVTLGLYQPDSDVNTFQRCFELGKYEALTQLKPTFNPGDEYLLATSESCDECDKTHMFSLVKRSVSVDKDGNTENKDKKLIDRLFIQKQAIEEIKKHFEAAEKQTARTLKEDATLAEETPPET